MNTEYYKDLLAQFMHAGVGDFGHWLLNDEVDDEYVRQMTSEHKVVVDKRTGFVAWRLIADGMPNHLWDCEHLQIAGADIADLRSAAPADAAPREQIPPAPSTDARRGRDFLGLQRRTGEDRRGWLDGVTTGSIWR